MDKIFLLILNNALVAGWMILAVIAFRLLFKNKTKMDELHVVGIGCYQTFHSF